MIKNDWDEILKPYFNSKEYKKLENIINKEYKTKTIYPLKEEIFNALKLTPYKDVKVLIMGQDPYHGEGEANGLAFSVKENIKIPPSLRNIFKELKDDLNIDVPKNGDLTKWAKEGVLLLNSSLTVIKDTPNSHKNLGWENFSDYIIEKLNNKETPVVFILWGNNAKEKERLITNKKHLIIKSPHPSPFSANKGFFGSKPFSKTNTFLIENNLKPINWDL